MKDILENEIKKELNFKEKIIFKIFKKTIIKVYKKGIENTFNRCI